MYDYSLNCTDQSVENTITKSYKISSLGFCNAMTPQQMVVGA